MHTHRANKQPSVAHRAGEKLIGLSCLVIEMADNTLAQQDVEKAQALVELAMAVLHTACIMEPQMQIEMDLAKSRLDAVTESVCRASRPDPNDPDDQWPYRVI